MMSMGASHTPHIFNGLRVLSVVGAGFLAWMPVVRLSSLNFSF